MAAMPVNPYESSHAVADDNRSRETVPIPATTSVIVVATAGIVGGSLFLASMRCMVLIKAYTAARYVPLPLAIAAALIVLLAADWHFQRQRPAFGSAVIGFLLASPLALAFAVGLGWLAYGMGSKNPTGAALLWPLSYGSFFLIQSLGGWIAICLARRRSRF